MTVKGGLLYRHSALIETEELLQGLIQLVFDLADELSVYNYLNRNRYRPKVYLSLIV